MTALAYQQQALVEALFAQPTAGAVEKVAALTQGPWARGLKVYQANGHALAERALQSAYPVVAQLLGDHSFANLARAFWHAHPPQRGDVAQWGPQLPNFLSASMDLRDEPYMEDVARLEWALHDCATAVDGVVDLPSLALLTTQDPDALELVLAPGSAVVSSNWPIVSIAKAHRTGATTMAQAGAMVRQRLGQVAVVWRAGYTPETRQALAGEAQLLTELLARQSLGHALGGATALDFAVWLPQAVQTGLVLGARLKTTA